MDKVAIVFGSMALYWHGIFVALGALNAILLCCMLVKLQGYKSHSVLTFSAFSAPVCLIFSRLSYWCFNAEQFTSLGTAALGEGNGGYSLPGLFIALVVCALISKKLKIIENTMQFFDALAPSLALGIATGRLGSYFSGDDRGNVVSNIDLQRFPWAVYSQTQGEWLFATFIFESLAAFIILFILLGYFISIYGTGKKRAERNDCNVALLFLSLFGTTQGVLESTRSDSVFMNTISFVRIIQIMSLLFIVFCLVIFSVRSIKRNGLTVIHFVCWAGSIAALILAFFMEYKLASNVILRNYSIMASCLCFVFLITTLLHDSCYSGIPQHLRSPLKKLPV